MSTPTTTNNIPTCDVCGKTFKNNQGLDYHMKNFVCQKFTCPYCSRRLKTSLGLKYHIDNKICLPPAKIPVKIVSKCDYHTYTIPRDDIKLADVMRSVDGNFGEILFNAENIILKLIELTLANPKLDQYWSCYISNRRQPYIVVYDGDGWKIQPQGFEFDELSKWALEKINKYLHDNKAITKRTYWTKYYLTKDQCERQDHKIHKGLRQGLFCLFVNQKQAIFEKARITGLKVRP